MTTPTAQPTLRLVDLGRHLWTRRTQFALFVGTVTVLSIAVTYALPYWYRSGAEFTIEAGPTAANASSGVLGIASQLGLASLAGGVPSVNYYEEVLGSDLVLDHVALGALPADSQATRYLRTFSVGHVADTPRLRDEARQRFQHHFGTSTNGRANTISFWVEARTAYAARSAADTILAVLDATITSIRRQRASAERAFLESRLDTALQMEGAVEDTLRSFYLHNRIINTPDLQFTEARLKREVDFALQLTLQLRTQVEQARLQEVRDTPVVSLVAAPELPGKRSWPRRSFVALSALLASAACYAVWIMLRLVLPLAG